jgi:cytochrome c biogenesis factor
MKSGRDQAYRKHEVHFSSSRLHCVRVGLDLLFLYSLSRKSPSALSVVYRDRGMWGACLLFLGACLLLFTSLAWMILIHKNRDGQIFELLFVITSFCLVLLTYTIAARKREELEARDASKNIGR